LKSNNSCFRGFYFKGNITWQRCDRQNGTGYIVTGWFKAQVFKILLDELGYEVRKMETLDYVAFYIFSAKGDLDFGF